MKNLIFAALALALFLPQAALAKGGGQRDLCAHGPGATPKGTGQIEGVVIGLLEDIGLIDASGAPITGATSTVGLTDITLVGGSDGDTMRLSGGTLAPNGTLTISADSNVRVNGTLVFAGNGAATPDVLGPAGEAFRVQAGSGQTFDVRGGDGFLVSTVAPAGGLITFGGIIASNNELRIGSGASRLSVAGVPANTQWRMGAGSVVPTLVITDDAFASYDHTSTLPQVAVHSSASPAGEHSQVLRLDWLGLHAGNEASSGAMESDSLAPALTFEAADAFSGGGTFEDGGSLILIPGSGTLGGSDGLIVLQGNTRVTGTLDVGPGTVSITGTSITGPSSATFDVDAGSGQVLSFSSDTRIDLNMGGQVTATDLRIGGSDRDVVLQSSNQGIQIAADNSITFSATNIATAAKDSGLERNDPGTLEITDGSTGQGNLIVGGLTVGGSVAAVPAGQVAFADGLGTGVPHVLMPSDESGRIDAGSGQLIEITGTEVRVLAAARGVNDYVSLSHNDSNALITAGSGRLRLDGAGGLTMNGTNFGPVESRGDLILQNRRYLNFDTATGATGVVGMGIRDAPAAVLVFNDGTGTAAAGGNNRGGFLATSGLYMGAGDVATIGSLTTGQIAWDQGQGAISHLIPPPDRALTVGGDFDVTGSLSINAVQLNLLTPGDNEVLTYDSATDTVSLEALPAATLDGIVNTTTGRLEWSTGSGGIVHILGPSDNTFLINAGAGRPMIIATSAGDLTLNPVGNIVIADPLVANNSRWQITVSGELDLAVAGHVAFAATTDATTGLDTGIERQAAGVLEVTNGSMGQGALSTLRQVESITGPKSTSQAETWEHYDNQGAGSTAAPVTLPAVLDGLTYSVTQVDSGTTGFVPPAGSRIVYSGGELADGEALETGAIGSSFSLVCSGTAWLVGGEVGTLVEGNAMAPPVVGPPPSIPLWPLAVVFFGWGLIELSLLLRNRTRTVRVRA